MGLSTSRFRLIIVGALVVILAACAHGAFEIDGLWKSDQGTVISLQDGSASASLFGFDGGPDGSYQLSSKQPDGTYELYGSHLTGGTVEYQVTVHDDAHITLTRESQSTFAPKKLQLTRQ